MRSMNPSYAQRFSRDDSGHVVVQGRPHQTTSPSRHQVHHWATIPPGTTPQRRSEGVRLPELFQGRPRPRLIGESDAGFSARFRLRRQQEARIDVDDENEGQLCCPGLCEGSCLIGFSRRVRSSSGSDYDFRGELTAQDSSSSSSSAEEDDRVAPAVLEEDEGVLVGSDEGPVDCGCEDFEAPATFCRDRAYTQESDSDVSPKEEDYVPILETDAEEDSESDSSSYSVEEEAVFIDVDDELSDGVLGDIDEEESEDDIIDSFRNVPSVLKNDEVSQWMSSSWFSSTLSLFARSAKSELQQAYFAVESFCEGVGLVEPVA